MRYVPVSLCLLLSGTALAAPPHSRDTGSPFVVDGRDYTREVLDYIGQSRPEGMTGLEYARHREQLLRSLPGELQHMLRFKPSDPTPEQLDVPYLELDLGAQPQQPPEWGPLDAFQSSFEAQRDRRFMPDPELSHGRFLRRITWLFPDDGCFARANLMAQGMAGDGFDRPLTLFVFPPDEDSWLELETEWSPTGTVQWGWHVAPVVLSEGELVVLDAAINNYEPMPVEEWLLSFLPSLADARVTLCDEHALLPDHACWTAPATNDPLARTYENAYMQYEWDRVRRLGYDPYAVLGDSPPWSDPSADAVSATRQSSGR